MPTIDQLAPATSAGDGDELIVSQNNIVRKITRAQLLAGVQTQLMLPGGGLLGRSSTGVGAPETIAVGSNLVLTSGTLSANATPYSIAMTAPGLVPASNDLVPAAQNGQNVAIPYSVFLQGLSTVPNVDGSQLMVTPRGSTVGVRLADFSSSVLGKAGGSLTGPLQLSGDPTTPLQAATKAYVDGQVGFPRSGFTMTGPIVLASDPVSSLNPVTKSYADQRVLKSGDVMTGPLLLAADPITPFQAATKSYVDGKTASALPLNGGVLAGPLTLAGDPTNASHAATRRYVDANPAANGVVNVKLPPCGAKLDGRSDDTAAFVAAYQICPAGGTIYVPNGTTVVQPATSWGVPLTKRVKWIIDGTTLADGSSLADAIPNGGGTLGLNLPAITTGFGTTGAVISQASSQPSDFAVLHASYVVSHAGGGTQSVISNSRVDTIISDSPSNNVWSGVDRLVWNGTQTPSATTPSKHVGRYVQAVRQTIGTDGTGRPLPQPSMWSSFIEYRDTTGKPSSWASASIAAEVDWIGNGPDDAGQRQIQSLLIGQHDTAGAAVEVSTGIGVSLAGGSTGKISRVFNIAVPYSVSVLDTSNATQLPGAAAIRLASGQAIAFEATNSVNLSYSGSVSAVMARYGAVACAVGRGISVAFGIVFSTNATLSANSAGSVVFLVGGGTYAITLPPASALAAGTGFTFSALSGGVVSILPSSGNTIELSPVNLRQYDRYHIISDGSSLWREVFRSNSVSPRFSGPPVLPSYPVAGLPAPPGAGAKAFASNGRKPSEGAGAGTGVEVFHDGNQWISVCSGSQVAA